MRRRAAAALLLLALVGCDPHTTQQQSAPPGDLCERLRPHLPGNWTTEHAPPHPAAPLSDTCTLVDSTRTAHRIQVLVSILPVTDELSARYRKADETSAATSGFAAKITDGGLGTGSWALNPAAAAPWLVFRTANRQVRLRVENAGAGTMDELRTIAHAITALPGGLPVVKPKAVQSRCERGTAAAEHILGGPAVVRRDALVDGHLWCQWGSAAASVFVTSGAGGSDEAVDFYLVRDAGTSTMHLARRVAVGAEGWQQRDGYLSFRTARGEFVKIASAPYDEMKPVPIVMLARAIAPAYS
ncbi:hypothetical protein [Kribbella sp.]|uniref:hypothetical protein n=1 Tax=Kribbella sp. TaxID=1871183 RepID=UPI002D67A9F0|nr:hypothetical protein [Kribbella sp.]HZX08005.1 hypothetical protein [Kribbella sp.]